MKLHLLCKSVAAYRSGQLGDAVAYKAAALTDPGPAQLVADIQGLCSPLPKIDLCEFEKLKTETFGNACHAFMTANQLTPLCISATVACELASENVVAVRYVLLHDAFHVLLGFDASLAGELGVWTFVAAQGYSRTFASAAATARVVYPCVAFRQREKLKQAVDRASYLARVKRAVLALPFEELWAQPLIQVRRQIFGADISQFQPDA